ncbi:MAG: plasmid maintenance system antidote protein [Bacteroidales bacterium]|jgi:addiction module HigA family antidote|nr:plasmid maintenance system antidote protein [Bacteroidales bacterium]
MLPDITKLKGVHPGAVLGWELKNRSIESKQFALSLDEHPQTVNAVMKGRRKMNPSLSIKLGKALDTDPEYFMLLQVYYEIEKERTETLLKNQPKPDLSKLRKTLFWDTNIDRIDWEKQKKAVIGRIFERGNETEIMEIISFYGETTVKQELSNIPEYLPVLSVNVKKYLHENTIASTANGF